MSKAILRHQVAWALIAAALSGCAKSEFELAAATGQVTVDGRPYSQGKVMFSPVAKDEQRIVGRVAFGKLKPDGTFSLSTYEQDDGAVIGDHWATLIHLESDLPSNSAAPSSIPPFKRVTYPTRLTVVGGEQNTFQLNFTSDDIKRYGQQRD